MLSRELIEKNVDIVLQMPSLFDKVEQCLITGDLVAASAILENTASFRVYFESVFKRIKFEIPYDGKDITVAANMLGIDLFRSIVLSYFIFLKSPKTYRVFNLKIIDLIEFNSKILSDWVRIINTFDDKFRAYLPFASYSLACLIICEKLFSMYPYPVSDIVLYSDVSYNKILQKRYGFSLWEIVLKAMNMEQNSLSEDDQKMLYYFKILLSYEASRPEFYECGIDKILDVSVHADMQSIIFIKKAIQK